MQHARFARLLDADAGIEPVSARKQPLVGRNDEVVDDRAAVMSDVGRIGTWRVFVPSAVPGRTQPKADTACRVEDNVGFDQGVAATGPDMDGVLGQPPAAPE